MIKKEEYRSYSLKKSLLINEKSINRIIISSHYEEKHADYLDDKIILQLVKQLDKKRFESEDQKEDWEYFSYSPLYYQKKVYKLVWCLKDNASFLGVRSCYRYKKYEKKK